ncbi:YheC/YheD family protein [Paenibacillus silviterrae]|uniref:YheC/YheD family protein n=1 Tax=Paenibacillus silviterrae TaxID=3242194 RepID=UPI0025432942|nr:YheC/YheD family protein [Paenibacillus chinjuensis]
MTVRGYHGVSNYRKLKAFRERHTKLRYISRPMANKWTMHRILSEHDQIKPHMPDTEKFEDAKSIANFMKKHSIVYMKPMNGTGGRGILRLQRLPGGEHCLLQGRDPNRRILLPQKVTPEQITSRVSGWKLGHRYILQQGIPLQLKDGRVHDFRMLVQKDSTGGVAGYRLRRTVSDRSAPVTSNLHGGGSAAPMETLLKRRFGSQAKVDQIKQKRVYSRLECREAFGREVRTFMRGRHRFGGLTRRAMCGSWK